MPRVSLRAIERSDGYELLEWRNDPKNRMYFREYRMLSEENQDLWFDSLLENDSVMMFAIVSDDELAGACGFTSIDWISQSAEVSLYIGDGYIDEIVAPRAFYSLQEYGRKVLGLRRVWAEIWEFDVDKRALLENSKFTLAVTRRQAHWDDGWHDALIYERIFE